VVKNKLQQMVPAFTIVEMLVVISLTVLLMLTATSLFLAMIIGNTKGTVTQKVKSEGEYALSQIEFLLRNAVSLQPNLSAQTCATGMDSISLKSIDNGVTTLAKETDPEDGFEKIASNAGIYLTSGATEITAGPTFDCRQSDDGSKTYVTVSFTLRKGTPGVDKPRDIVEQPFSTGVSLRTY
jgi:Tfp pilus assembly protein FimT